MSAKLQRSACHCSRCNSSALSPGHYLQDTARSYLAGIYVAVTVSARVRIVGATRREAARGLGSEGIGRRAEWTAIGMDGERNGRLAVGQRDAWGEIRMVDTGERRRARDGDGRLNMTAMTRSLSHDG